MKKTILKKTAAVFLSALAALGISSSSLARNVYAERQAIAVCSEGGTPHRGYIGVIRDDIVPAPDNTREQYICCADETGYAYIGYEFFEPFSANTLIFTSGAVSDEGGWFADGDLRVEGFAGGVWTQIPVYATPEYPVSSESGAFTPGAVYVFNFMPVFVDGIRLVGRAGGTEGFITCSELDVLCSVDLGEYESLKDYVKAKSGGDGWIESRGHPIAAVPNPDVSGGSGRLADINDGYIPKVGDSYQKQFDTVHSEWKKKPGHEEYLGYVFGDSVEIEALEFTEGGNFYDGGWFRDGSLRIEVYRDYQWTAVPFASDPEYPVSNSQSDFLPDFETYTFTLDEPVTCSGVRIVGAAGGSASFISCGELRVRKPAEKTEVKTEPLPGIEPAPGTEPVPAGDAAPDAPQEPSVQKASLPPALILVPAAVLALAAALAVIVLRRKRRT